MRSLLLAGLAASSLGVQDAPSSDHVIFHDAEHDVSILYDFTPAGVEFSAHLPAGWSFRVAVDGDQDGRWGDGRDNGRTGTHPTPDRAFAQDSRNGVFCSAYILSSVPQDPSQVYAESECGGYPSQGSVVMSGFDAHMRATITLRIPAQELFGDRPDAHLQICLWDTQRRSCHHTPAEPFVLRRPASPTPG
jgi:hypothetical protein